MRKVVFRKQCISFKNGIRGKAFQGGSWPIFLLLLDGLFCGLTIGDVREGSDEEHSI